MIRIPLKVKANLLTQEELVTIASGSSNSIKVKFDIDPNSDFADNTLQKRAIFRYYQGSYFISDVDANGEVYVPKFVIAYPYFKVALRAESENATIVATTNEVQVPVEKSPVFYETTITDGDVTIRNLDGALNIYKAGDVTFIDFTASYKTAVDAVIAGTYATTSALNSVASDVNLIKDDIINMSTSISDLQGDIGDLETAKADKDNVYTKGETEERLAEKQPVGDYATNTDLDNLETRVSEVEENKADKSEVSEVATDITHIKNGTTHLFETITDKNGNPRFVEGDITMNTIEGVTQTYGKWSLSGTHLMFVIVGTIANGTVISPVQYADVVLPNYINAKIKPIAAGYIIYRKSEHLYSNSGGTTDALFEITKLYNGVRLETKSNKTANENLSFRIQFDLLIDDE